jgi:signal transduction histidine kinase
MIEKWSPSRSLSAKLSLSILLLAVPIFVLSLGVLFVEARQMIQDEATGRAQSVLSATIQRMQRYLIAIETATNANSWLVEKSLQPDSLLALSAHIVSSNSHVDGCSISTEPGMVSGCDDQFSVYTLRQADSIQSVIEAQYDYFSKIWYKTPRDLKRACWLAYYDEADSLEITLEGMIATYAKPIYKPDSTLVGIISSDLSLLHLSKEFSELKPYPNSYFMMVDKEGRFFIHPDTTRLFSQTIFSHADPRRQPDLIALGHEMIKGNSGTMDVVFDGSPCLVCYQPVEGTTWSFALVCPNSDVLAGYQRQFDILVPILIIGLLVILLLSHHVVATAIRPLHVLLKKTQSVAAGNLNVVIPHTRRVDVVGRLQNSFSVMLQSLDTHIGIIRNTTEQTIRCNKELEVATHLAQEAVKQKTAFIQNVSHQIRTPLNIIMGFSQVLGNMATEGASLNMLPEEERNSITETMTHNAMLLLRMLQMLFDSSEIGQYEERIHQQLVTVSCNEVAREAYGYIHERFRGVHIELNTEVADDFCIKTNRHLLMITIRELLYNAAKYSDGQHILLHVSLANDTVSFVIQDTGKDIPEAEVEKLFNFFAKVDDLSEGLGLGIPLSKRHAQSLGGDLVLDTTYHGGCRFVLTVPLSK